MSHAPPSGLGFRPTFRLPVASSSDEVNDALRESFESAPQAFHCDSVGPHLVVSHDEARRHLWSPWLNLDVRDEEESEHAVVYARFSPNPHLWTAIVLANVGLAFITLMGASLALAQWMMQATQWGWWIALAALALSAATWFGSRVGQGLAAREPSDEQG